MNKTFLRLGALALVCMMSISSFALEFIQNGLRYRVISSVDKTVSLKKVEINSYLPNAEVPEKVENGGTEYTVTTIDKFAFAGSNVSYIAVNANLEDIGDYAFATECDFTTIYFAVPFAPKRIGDYPFAQKDQSWTNTVILEKETKDGTVDLSKVTNGETYLGKGVFANIKFDNANKIKLGLIKSLPEAMFRANTTGIDYYGIGFLCELPFASELESVGAEAFCDSYLCAIGYRNTKEYYLPGTLKTVGDYAFANTWLNDDNSIFGYTKCMQFSDVINPGKITSVGKYAFQYSDWLTNDRFENLFGSFETLDYTEGSFMYCGLTSIDLSNAKVKDVVPAFAFSHNPLNGSEIELVYGEDIVTTAIKLNPECKSIGEQAFAYCGIHTGPSRYEVGGVLDILVGVNEIGKMAFRNNHFDMVFIRQNDPKDIKLGVYALPETMGTDPANAFWVAPQKGVLPKFQAFDEDGNPTQWWYKKYYQFMPDYLDGCIEYCAIQNRGDVNYKAESYVNDSGDPVDITIIDRFVQKAGRFGYVFTGATVTEINPVIFSSNTDAQAQVKSVTFLPQTTYVPAMNDMAILEKVVLPASLEELPVNTFQNDVLLTSVNLGETQVTELPQNTFYGASALAEIDLANIITFGNSAVRATAITEAKLDAAKYIYMNAFRQNPNLASVEFPNVEIVDQYAFESTVLEEVTLPACLSYIGEKAFNVETLATVNVSYENVEDVPQIEDNVFYLAPRAKEYTAALHSEVLPRESFLKLNGWKRFLTAFGTTVKVNNQPIATNEDDVFVLVDEGAEKVSVSKDTEVGVEYVRNFESTAWQCWFVPFEMVVGSEAAQGAQFARLYDTKVKGDATTIEYQPLAEGDILEANKPYLVKPAAKGEVTFTAEKLFKTNDELKVTVSNAKFTYTFQGTYTKKVGENPATWYGLVAKNGSFAPAGENAYVNAYRFFMVSTEKGTGDPYAVKFVVLGDEDPTGISDINADAADAPMFDLMGRQITAPSQGQVYIQNGVKKLAK